MNQVFILSTANELYEIVAWLIVTMVIMFSYKYLRQIVEYVLLKLYEFFIQHKF